MDSYVKVERDRIEYIRNNQKQLRMKSYQGLREEGTGEAYFFYFSGNFFFYSSMYQYVQKIAQNYLCWSNIRDFISCTGQNTCKKGIYSVSILRIGFRSMCISLKLHIFSIKIYKLEEQYD